MRFLAPISEADYEYAAEEDDWGFREFLPVNMLSPEKGFVVGYYLQ